MLRSAASCKACQSPDTSSFGCKPVRRCRSLRHRLDTLREASVRFNARFRTTPQTKRPRPKKAHPSYHPVQHITHAAFTSWERTAHGYLHNIQELVSLFGPRRAPAEVLLPMTISVAGNHVCDNKRGAHTPEKPPQMQPHEHTGRVPTSKRTRASRMLGTKLVRG